MHYLYFFILLFYCKNNLEVGAILTMRHLIFTIVIGGKKKSKTSHPQITL